MIHKTDYRCYKRAMMLEAREKRDKFYELLFGNVLPITTRYGNYGSVNYMCRVYLSRPVLSRSTSSRYHHPQA